MTHSQNGSPTPSHIGPDAVRLVAKVLPTVSAAVEPTRGFLSALGLLARMYTDPRYRVSPLGRVGPVVGIAIAVVNYLFWNNVLTLPLIAPVAERALLIGLAIGIFKNRWLRN